MKFITFLTACFTLSGALAAQPFDRSLFQDLRWRSIGPFRGGRTLAVAGIVGQPNIYYFGAVDGGVWKTSNGGETWQPLFQQQSVASIGALAISPADSSVIYAGTGEADMRSDITFGDGIYKSTDGGATWKSIGLRDSRQIGRIVINPRDPNVILVAALGHAYGPNIERGVFRSADGGATWQKVLYKDENTGAIDVAMDPANPQIVFAALWRTRRPPWSTYPPIGGPGGGLYKSADGGLTWKQITGNGLPGGEWGRVGIAIARSDSRRVYALIDAREGKSGLYRSDDGGENWVLVGTDSRIHSRAWYFSEIVVDPKNPDVVYAPNVALYRSIDGGRTFVAIKGAPGGDDYHSLWVDQENPQRMIFGSDQGAAISVDGGATWSSWYNQPTAQFYHVAVDNQFPYRVYGAQQDSGTASVANRSDYGSITFRDWHPIGAEESGYIAPDPRDPNIIYGGGPYGGAFRFDLRTGQTQTISPSPAENFGAEISERHYRFTWTSPLVFSPQDPQVLYLGAQMVLKTTDGGTSWSEMSPDLTGCDAAQANAAPDVKPAIETAKARCYGVIYTLAPSPKDANVMWAGSDTGLVQITRDGGKTWSTVTPPGLSDWSKITLIEASPGNAATAYAAVDRHRLDDVNPYIYRTRDYGKTWTKIIEGISAPAFVNVLREDPARKGLVFAGTETGIYVSFDAGDHWQSLQLNLPTASIRDLVIHGDDLVVATHGRSFWILDDITPLRQISRQIAAEEGHLFQPQTAVRLRRSENSDTPLTPEVPAGENPPSGAVIDYLLPAPAEVVTLEILDGAGRSIRKFSSTDAPPRPEKPPAIADYWFKPAPPLGNKAGLNRFVWDLRYPPPPTIETSYSISSIYGQDAIREPEGPLALPGNYQVRLTVAGKSYVQPLVVKMDPRVGTGAADLQRQFELDSRIASALERDTVAYREVKRAQARAQQPATSKEFQALAAELAALAGDSDPDSNKHVALKKLNGQLASLETAVESADRAPTAQAQSTFERLSAELDGYLKQWEALRPRLEQLLPSTPRP